jgi:hypothetical protein
MMYQWTQQTGSAAVARGVPFSSMDSSSAVEGVERGVGSSPMTAW